MERRRGEKGKGERRREGEGRTGYTQSLDAFDSEARIYHSISERGGRRLHSARTAIVPYYSNKMR